MQELSKDEESLEVRIEILKNLRNFLEIFGEEDLSEVVIPAFENFICEKQWRDRMQFVENFTSIAT